MGNTGSLQEMHANCQGDLASYYRNSRIRTGGIDRTGVAIKKYQQENGFSSPIINYEREINSKPGAGDWAKSFPRTVRQTTNSTNESPLPHFKVLPHLNESLKLRTTANGAILHSGGTISGRREQQQNVAELNTRGGVHHQPIIMQRSRSIIYEREGGGPKQQQQNTFNGLDFDSSKTGVLILRRAQTQFHLNYKDTRQHQQFNRNETQNLAAAASSTTSRSVPDLRHTRTADTIATPAATNRCSKNTKATNKYNKKKKAPAAPANVITLSMPLSNANAKTNFVTPSTSGSSRRQNITVNNNKGVNIQKKTQTTTTAAAALATTASTELALGKSRIFLTKAETDSNIAGQRIFLGQKKLAPPVVQQLPYRREKSFDSTLLYERRTLQNNVAGNQPKERQQSMPMQNDKREGTKIPQPHHKRTFYFGMDTRRTAAATTKEAEGETATKFTVPIERRASPTASSSSESIITTAVYDISISPKQYEDDNDNCNGLQVNVRPSLPRRQMNIPRFSPAAAWRMLTEEQQNVQLQRQSMKVQGAAALATAQQQQQIFRSTAMDTLNNEQPIHPVCKLRPSAVVSAAVDVTRGPPKKLTSKPYATPWTPQQDLEDDDDDHSSSDEFPTKTNSSSLFLVESSSNLAATTTEGKDNFKNLNGNGAAAASVHVFSLSLPRDGHFGIGFCDNKPLSEKKSGFSSLQKLKRTVSGGNCGCIQTKYTDKVMEQISGTGTDQFKTSYDDVALTTSGVGCTLQENTSDNNIQGTGTNFPNGYRSDNWVLSKTKFGAIGDNHDTFHTAAGKGNSPTAMNPITSSHKRWNTLVSNEPISLSYLTAGKHVMYLPGHNNFTNSSYSNKMIGTVNDDNKCKEVKRKQNPKTTKSRKKELHTRQSLQDPIPLGVSNSRSKYTAKRDLSGERRSSLQNEKQQCFSFQSTVRLIEKRRLAEKLSKDAEIKEEKRRSELEAMKRVEEDFQRKRASEKATIRQQLRLVSNFDTFDHQINQFQSLPMKFKHFNDSNVDQLERERLKHNQEDSNNNIYYRADPEGAVSSPSNSPILQYDNDSTQNTAAFNSKPFDFNGTSSVERFQIQNYRHSDINNKGEILEFQRAASLVEPYVK